MVRLLCAVLVTLGLSACGGNDVAGADPKPDPSQTITGEQSSASIQEMGQGNGMEEHLQSESSQETQPSQENSIVKITFGEYELQATLESNPSAEEWKQLLAQGPITISMEDYGGFEKVGDLGTTLTRSDQTITTEPGDIILYQGNQITIYYGTNTWNFTRLAKIQDAADLKEKLGKGTVQVTFSLE
ncbi:MAG: cyclophilin-like fold protein [Lawsonibacter sp.]|jgi:hypothetical protein